MGIMDRFRGKIVIESGIYGSVPQNQIEALSSSPMATPTIVNNGNSSEDAAGGLIGQVTTITFNRNQSDDTGTVAIARRSTIVWHLEDTAGALFTTATSAFSANTSGNTAAGLVTVDSTLSYISGRVLCDTAGSATINIGTTTGNGSTARMFLTLPNGEIVSGSTLVFTT